MTKDELEAIRQRAEAATEGEWCEGYNHYVLVDNFKGSYQTFGVARCARKEDTEFIAHARQDIPALLGRIAALLEKISLYEAYAQDYDYYAILNEMEGENVDDK
ncbi:MULTISPECIES: hypothetical protein [unclassified Bacillus (in: firmicutes)]|uniref:hypothetical protein n=1 Tax=unclassified Bacillus (in: firmicutes) TaxID=185979 RepID=UPI00163C9732|nr:MULTISPECIES: hypothetical protein [unclassified Bacillus (in: firmicutes)]QNH48692.1 hypothetical protein H7F25_04255 [Bacillus sp. PAMC28571]QNK42987.1 hypothetical protein H7F24_10820 [Bacillus sp. PAMC22265]